MNALGFVGAFAAMFVVGWVVHTTTSGHRRARHPPYNPRDFAVQRAELSDTDQRYHIIDGPEAGARLDDDGSADRGGAS